MPGTKPLDEVVDSSPEVLREQALRQVKKRRDFRAHVFAFLVVNIVLWIAWSINGITSHSWDLWPLWVTLLWGLGLTFNAWDVYFRRPITEQDISREMDRLARGLNDASSHGLRAPESELFLPRGAGRVHQGLAGRRTYPGCA